MRKDEKFSNPGDKVVLEDSFDDLMKKISGEELMDVSAREVVCEWLSNQNNGVSSEHGS